jgi:uncharacterized protein YaiL (DUF2058 family)
MAPRTNAGENSGITAGPGGMPGLRGRFSPADLDPPRRPGMQPRRRAGEHEMGSSLQEQLLKAGLVDKGKANQIDKGKKKARKARKAGAPAEAPKRVDEVQQAAKAARDRELNERRNEARRQREIAAQITDLVRRHRHPRAPSDDDRPFHFESKGKIKRIYVAPTTQEMLTGGKLVIVNCNGVFELVPPDIAERIRQRNPSLVIDLPAEHPVDEDDPYAAYQVPDDLMW